MKTKFYLNAWFPKFDEASDKAAADAAAVATAKKTLTQDEVNTIVAKETAKFKATQQKYDDEIKALRARAELTAAERTELDERLARLQSEHMTKAEQLQADMQNQRKAAEASLKKAEQERGHFQQLFTRKMITSDVTQAAVTHKAINPGQIMALLAPMTQLVEELDAEGKPTGEFVSQVKYPTTDKDGKSIVLALSVDAAVKKMSSEDIHANLFQFEGKGGTGGRNAGSGQKLNMAEILSDPVKYREARAKGQIV